MFEQLEMSAVPLCTLALNYNESAKDFVYDDNHLLLRMLLVEWNG